MRLDALRVRVPLLAGLAVAVACGPQAAPAAASATVYSGVSVAGNCAPVAAASDGTMVWYSRNGSGLWDAYIGNAGCQGEPLLPAYAGNRGPAGITPDGRYVLLTTAVGWDKALPDSSPGRGSQNAIQLYDRQTGKLSTLLAGATSTQRGVIWPTFNETDTKIVWSQMIKAPEEDPPYGQWALHTANVDLEAGTLSNNVEWQDPDGQEAFYEVYGWVPHTNQLIFMSNTRATSSGMPAAQLWTLPEELNPATAPTRISPAFAPVWPWQSAVDVYHEFAHFAPGDPNTLYTSIGADTVGGDDLFSYDLRSQEASGLLGQPTRISYFGGDLNANWGSAAVPGWPFPTYTVVTTMAWVNGGWTITTCPDILCEKVNAWRIQELHTEPVSPSPGGGESRPPGLRHHRPVRPLAKGPACARSAGPRANSARARGRHSSAAAASRAHAHKPARKRASGSRGRALSHTCASSPGSRHRSHRGSRHRARGSHRGAS